MVLVYAHLWTISYKNQQENSDFVEKLRHFSQLISIQSFERSHSLTSGFRIYY